MGLSLGRAAALALLGLVLCTSGAAAADGCDPKKAIDCNFKYAVCVHGEWFKMTDDRVGEMGPVPEDRHGGGEGWEEYDGYPQEKPEWATQLQECVDTWRECVLKSGTRDKEHYTTQKGGEKINYGGSGECVMSFPEVGTINDDVSRELGPPQWDYTED